MYVKTVTVGMFYTNCYLLWNEHRDAYVIDPGADADQILQAISDNGLNVRALLLTHAHVDHIGAVPALVARYEVPVVLNPTDQDLYRSSDNAFPPWLPAPAGLPATIAALPDAVAGLEHQVMPTPGHTPGGLSYYFASQGQLFSGDTLFYRSVGRTDLPGGDWSVLERTIRDTLFGLPDAVQVCPGHGPETQVGAEKAQNPFVRAGSPNTGAHGL